MTSPPASESREWLTLGDASKQLGVSPATLRQWADKGKVRTFRTPGGHRRFSIAEMQSMVAVTPPSAHPTRQVELLIHSALGRARLDIASGRLDGETWHHNLPPAARDEHRQLGQRLMSLLLQALRAEKSETILTNQARGLGKEYARVSVEHATALADTLRAFLFFRDYVFEGLIELSESNDRAGLDVVDIYRRLNRLINEMLLSMIASYAGEKKRK
jgi:excisionase family DNA binding protein